MNDFKSEKILWYFEQELALAKQQEAYTKDEYIRIESIGKQKAIEKCIKLFKEIEEYGSVC